jgi:hypothetical protein
MLPADELRSLADDIKTRGLLNPITTDREGRILDGRNRLAACQLAGIPPSFTIYAGDDPDGYALAANGQRRDLGKGRKAMVAAKSCLISKQTTREAAAAIGVSAALVAKAATVRDHAPDLVPKVINGEMGLDEAYKIARQHKAPASPEAERDDWFRTEFAAERPREVSAANDVIARLERGEALSKSDEHTCVLTTESASHRGYWHVAIIISSGFDQDGILIDTRPMLAVGVPWFLMKNGVSVRGEWDTSNLPPTDHPIWQPINVHWGSEVER